MWQLDNTNASFTCESGVLKLDAARPEVGASLTTSDGQVIAGSLWAWRPEGCQPPRLSDAYTRGADLVLDYGPREDFPFHTQVYWRCEPSTAALDVNLMLSIRTHKLDTHPVYEVRSAFAAQGVPLEGAASLGARFSPDGGAWTAVETAESGDLSADQAPVFAPAGGMVGRRWRMFDLFLEKGVIRRSRLALAVRAGALTDAQAIELAERLSSAPTPLSA